MTPRGATVEGESGGFAAIPGQRDATILDRGAAGWWSAPPALRAERRAGEMLARDGRT